MLVYGLCALGWYVNRNVFRVTKYAFYFFYILYFARCVFQKSFKAFQLFAFICVPICAKIKPKKEHLRCSHTILFKFRINSVIFMDVFAGFQRMKFIFGIYLNSRIIFDLNSPFSFSKTFRFYFDLSKFQSIWWFMKKIMF